MITSVNLREEIKEVLNEMKEQGVIESRSKFINEAIAYYLMELAKLEWEAIHGHNDNTRTT